MSPEFEGHGESLSPDFDTAVAEFNVAFGVGGEDAVLQELERWLAAIEADRAERQQPRGAADGPTSV
jgi:hypothetical protein